MTTTFTRYDDYMAALGWPEHLIMRGPDWWGCICNVAGEAEMGVEAHTDINDAATVTTDWGWGDVATNRTMADVHQWLWEQETF